MARHLVSPARLGWLRSLLVSLEVDLWGPAWLWNWITQNDPQIVLYVSISQSLDRTPEKWSINPFGVTNREDGIGVFTADGPSCTAVAVDGDRQHYPTGYFRKLLYDAVMEHRRVTAAGQALNTAGRLQIAA